MPSWYVLRPAREREGGGGGEGGDEERGRQGVQMGESVRERRAV